MENNILSIIVFVLFSITFFIFFQFWNKRHLIFDSANIRGPGIISTMWLVFTCKNLTSLHLHLYQKYGPIFKMWMGLNLIIVVSKPKYIESVLTKSVEKRVNFFNILTGNGLLSITSEEKWRKHRKILNPLFKQNILNSHFNIVCHNADNLVFNMQKSENVRALLIQHNVQLACECFFEKDILTSKEIEKYSDLFLEALDLWGCVHSNPLTFLTDIFWRISSNCKKFQNVCEQLKMMAWSIVERSKNPVYLLQYLLQMHSKEEAVEEVQSLLNATLTTSAAIEMFVLVVLAIHQDLQEKVYQEIKQIIGDSDEPITLENLAQLKCLDRSVKETMRLFSPAVFNGRLVKSAISLDKDYIIPKDSFVIINTFNFHRDEKYWKNPLKFDPDRFMAENLSTLERGVYIPFGHPPRNCIGQVFAMMSVKVTLATILRRYKITGCNYDTEENIKVKILGILEPEADCQVNFSVRTK